MQINIHALCVFHNIVSPENLIPSSRTANPLESQLKRFLAEIYGFLYPTSADFRP
jgi:hypothetical protein